MSQTIVIKGTEYRVLEARTVAYYREQGLVNLAAEMDKAGVEQDLYITKPNGYVVFNALKFQSGKFSKLHRVARLAQAYQ